MVIIPRSKIIVLGGNIKPATSLRLSLKFEQQLLIPTLYFVDTKSRASASKFQIGSIGAAVINCKMDFFEDVWSAHPKDVEIVRIQNVSHQRFFPRSWKLLSEIAFVRAIEKFRLEVSRLDTSTPTEFEGYKITFKASMYKIIGEAEEPLHKKIGCYFLPH